MDGRWEEGMGDGTEETEDGREGTGGGEEETGLGRRRQERRLEEGSGVGNRRRPDLQVHPEITAEPPPPSAPHLALGVVLQSKLSSLGQPDVHDRGVALARPAGQLELAPLRQLLHPPPTPTAATGRQAADAKHRWRSRCPRGDVTMGGRGPASGRGRFWRERHTGDEARARNGAGAARDRA